jgi:nucleoside-diphosphate-sugar epimerase
LEGRTIITGCAVFIGSDLCDRLLADGEVVVGIDFVEDCNPRAQNRLLDAARRDAR